MNNLKQKILDRGKTCGTIINMGDACVSDIFSRVGFDFLWIDFEHSYLSYEQILTHTAISRANGTPVIVRVPQDDYTATKKVLEMGVDGIIFPMVQTAQEAAELIDATLYPPEGTRGFGPMAANQYGLADAADYVKSSNRELCRFVQLECQQIIDNLDELMGNTYIDGYIFGPNDLSGSIGDYLNVYDEKTTSLMAYAIGKLKSKNKYVGIATGSNNPDVVAHWYNMGADMLCAGCDYGFLSGSAVNMVNTFKNAQMEGLQCLER